MSVTDILWAQLTTLVSEWNRPVKFVQRDNLPSELYGVHVMSVLQM